MACGHCVTTCPTGALSISKLSKENCSETKDELDISKDAALQFLKSRRSVRAYKEKAINNDILFKVLDTTRWAASAGNFHSVHWLMIEDTNEARKLAALVIEYLRKEEPNHKFIRAWEEGHDMVFRGAPHIVVAHASKDNRYAAVECIIATTYMELAAHAFGLGACWSSTLQRAFNGSIAVREFFDLPLEHSVYGTLMIGYPKVKYRMIPERSPINVKWR
ncbi:MAG: nitroreductase [Clostridium sp. Maddingley MBC34-26]|nr:MAG: nitroreductase [Clostridium sp. Maddingley MBC34-26]